MTQDQTLNSLPPYLSDIITRHLYCPTLSRVLGDQQRTRFFFLELRERGAFHCLMGFRTEGSLASLFCIRLQMGNRLKPATKPRLPSKIVIDPGLGLKVPNRV